MYNLKIYWVSKYIYFTLRVTLLALLYIFYETPLVLYLQICPLYLNYIKNKTYLIKPTYVFLFFFSIIYKLIKSIKFEKTMNCHRIRIWSKYKQSFCRKDNFVKFVYLGLFFKDSHTSLCLYQSYYLLEKNKDK